MSTIRPLSRAIPAGTPKGPSGKVRVLVVDDSAVIRRLVTTVLERDPQVQVVGTASNGLIAQSRVDDLQPDVVTMDVEMPVMDGITAVKTLRKSGARMPIIMFSTLTAKGASATLEALAAGASDYVAKPSGQGAVEAALEEVGAQLLPRIHALVHAAAQRPSAPAMRSVTSSPAAPSTIHQLKMMTPPKLIVIGSSTGGPNALAEVVQAFDRKIDIPIVVVQHMPPVFTAQLAERLDKLGAMRVVEAKDRQVLDKGVIHIAPGGRHLRVCADNGLLSVKLSDEAPVHYVKPAADLLFQSAVKVVGASLICVVLTGMGSDGASGAKEIRDRGGRVIVQDEATSVVWGMPGAVVAAKAADAVLPLGGIGSALLRLSEEVLA